MPAQLALKYKGPTQQARAVSEAWGQENLYCPNCQSPVLNRAPNNSEAFDFVCPRCDLLFQLKSRSRPLGNQIVDAAYDSMVRAISQEHTLSLFALHYSRASWEVRNLILIPHFAFTISAIKPRPRPLGPDKRRAGWLGCDIVLTNIPPDAKIKLISDGIPTPPQQVRESFRRLKPLEEMGVKERGWTLDVLRVVRSLGKTEFSNDDVYAFAPHLGRLHPDNHRVTDKIRQQLQVLRDKGFLAHVKRGVWAMKE